LGAVVLRAAAVVRDAAVVRRDVFGDAAGVAAGSAGASARRASSAGGVPMAFGTASTGDSSFVIRLSPGFLMRAGDAPIGPGTAQAAQFGVGRHRPVNTTGATPPDMPAGAIRAAEAGGKSEECQAIIHSRRETRSNLRGGG